MSQLQRKINVLTAKMNHDSQCMHASWLALSRYTHSLGFILLGSTLAFMTGAILGYKQRFSKIAQNLFFMSARFYKIRTRAKFFLSIIP